jgi:hypothetical protein
MAIGKLRQAQSLCALQNVEGRRARVYSKALVEENEKPSRRTIAERDEASFEYRSGAPSKEKRFGEQKAIGCPVRRASRSEAVERFDPEG